MDWKIMAASFAALVIVSSVLLGGFGLGDFFSDIMNTIGDFLGSSPFGGLSTAADTASVITASILLQPSGISLQTEHSVNISTDSAEFEMFDGMISVDYEGNLLTIQPEDTELSITMPLQNTVIEHIMLESITIEQTSYEISDEKSGKTTGEGTVHISGFDGRCVISHSGILFEGNVSAVSVNSGESSWELK